MKMETPVAVFYHKRNYKRRHSLDECSACCLKKFTCVQREEIISCFPKEVQKQNQVVLDLLYQFGKSDAETENELEKVKFLILGKVVCEDCICILYDLSTFRYQRIKNFYMVGAKVINHGNVFRHYTRNTNSLQGQAWLNSYCNRFSEPMPHADIFHLHVPNKKAVLEEKPTHIELPASSLYKFWDHKVKVPTKNQIFARCPQCQGLRKRCFEAGKCLPALEAIKEEQRKHKKMYMTEKEDYYNRQTKSVNEPHELLCIIYDGMHKEKTKLPRFCANPSKDLESAMRIPCNLQGFICHREGPNLHPKQGFGVLNLCYADNANYILSSLLHILSTIEGPFPRNISTQFDNASNNKCNDSIGLFAYLISEEIFYNVYGNTLIVNHTHEDVDRMFENANEKFKKADMVIPTELSVLMKQVPYVVDVRQVPCVWDINNFLSPFLRTVHDFGNVHHLWVHRNTEGNVVLHYKRYVHDKWLPDSNDPTTYLSDVDKYGILVFKEKPHGVPSLVEPSIPFSDAEMEKLKSSISKLFQHPLTQDSKLEERKLWWDNYLTGESLKPQSTTWPIKTLRERRTTQNNTDATAARSAIKDLEHEEDDMPVVYSGPYVDPARKEHQAELNAFMGRGEWPIKKIQKERINPRTHSKEYLVEWKNSWVAADDVTDNCVKIWEDQKKKKKR